MNFTIMINGAAVVTSLIGMLTLDIVEDHEEQKRASKLEGELEQLQSDFESKRKKNIVFLDLGKG